MEYGVFTSQLAEIAQSRFWTLCLFCNSDKSILTAELYSGIDDKKTLTAIVKRDNKFCTTLYACKTPDGQVFSNDINGIASLVGQLYEYDVSTMKKIDSIQISEPYEMAPVSEKGIKYCLKQWRMGSFYSFYPQRGMQFQMVTNKIEYIFMIWDIDCNIYCGASVNIPCEDGMLGNGQYFRIRNYKDNSQPFCKFDSNLGKDISLTEAPQITCESGTCSMTEHGIFWPLKRYNNDEIVLNGCGGDEYAYSKNNGSRSEFFCFAQ